MSLSDRFAPTIGLWAYWQRAAADTRVKYAPSSNASRFPPVDMLDEARRIAVTRHSRAGSRAIMTISSAILIAAIVSLVMTMLCAGMGGIAGDRTYLSCRRGLLVRSRLGRLSLQRGDPCLQLRGRQPAPADHHAGLPCGVTDVRQGAPGQ